MKTSLRIVIGLCALVGCAKNGDAGKGAAEKGPRGLRAPGNDPAVVALATKAAACTWESFGFSSECADYKTWADAADPFADGRADATLINMAEDGDEKIRYLAVTKLDFRGEKYRTDKDLATRFVAVAEAEKTTTFASNLGSAIGEIDVTQTNLFDRIDAMVKKHDVLAVRAGIVQWLLNYNKTSDKVYALTKDALKDPSKDIRHAALVGLGNGDSSRQADTCKTFQELTHNADDDLAAGATQRLLGWGSGSCQTWFDTGLDDVETKIKTYKAQSASDYMYALGDLCQSDKATPPQKKRAEGLAKGVALTKTDKAYIRNAALDAVMKCDPAGGRAFAGKLGADTDADVQHHAKDLAKSKS